MRRCVKSSLAEPWSKNNYDICCPKYIVCVIEQESKQAFSVIGSAKMGKVYLKLTGVTSWKWITIWEVPRVRLGMKYLEGLKDCTTLNEHQLTCTSVCGILFCSLYPWKFCGCFVSARRLSACHLHQEGSLSLQECKGV